MVEHISPTDEKLDKVLECSQFIIQDHGILFYVLLYVRIRSEYLYLPTLREIKLLEEIGSFSGHFATKSIK